MGNIATDNPLAQDETDTLATLVAMIIPASSKYGVPAADDDIIMSDILGTARRHAELISNGLGAINAQAMEAHGASFSSLDHDTRMAIVEDFRRSSPRVINTIASMTIECYYRDARVMESLGMEARPPYPRGFELDQGDWSLLDQVRDRGKIWRDTD